MSGGVREGGSVTVTCVVIEYRNDSPLLPMSHCIV